MILLIQEITLGIDMSYRNRNDLSRFNIFRNKKGQRVYYDRRSKTGYIIQESDIKKFQVINSRVFMAAALGILCYGFLDLNVYICAVIAAIVFVISEIYFQKFFLKSFPQTKNLEGIIFVDPKEARLGQSSGAFWVKIVGYWACAIGIAVINFFSNYPLWQKVCIYGLALYAVYNGALHLIALLNSGKMDK